MPNKPQLVALFKEYYFLFILSFAYILLMTFNFPFFQQDYVNMSLVESGWSYEKLSSGFEFYFRPIENLIYFVFLNIFGMNALPFRIFKTAIAAGVFCMIYHLIKRYSENKNIAFLGGVFYLTSPAVLASVFLIYDFEILMQLIVLVSFLFFIDFFEKNEFEYKKIMIFLLLIYLAVITKESSKVFIGVIISTMFLLNKKNVKLIILCLILLFLAIKPGFLLGFSSSQSTNMFKILFEWSASDNLKIFAKNFLFLSFGILTSLIILLLIKIKNIKTQGLKFNLNKTIFFWFIWFLLTSISALFVPMSEARYMAVQFLPFTLFAFTIISKKFSNLNKKLKSLLIIFILASIIFNFTLSIQFRYGQMNFFKVLDESHHFFEKNYENSTLSFFGGDTFYYPMITSENNNSYFPRGGTFQNDTNKIFFLEGTSKNRQGKLERTFVEGPYCLMIYGSKENISNYCSVEIETKFFYPQKIEINIIGEQQTFTRLIRPPLGKIVSCEYLCPEFNESLKKKSINITTNKNRFNKILNFKVNN